MRRARTGTCWVRGRHHTPPERWTGIASRLDISQSARRSSRDDRNCSNDMKMAASGLRRCFDSGCGTARTRSSPGACSSRCAASTCRPRSRCCSAPRPGHPHPAPAPTWTPAGSACSADAVPALTLLTVVRPLLRYGLPPQRASYVALLQMAAMQKPTQDHEHRISWTDRMTHSLCRLQNELGERAAVFCAWYLVSANHGMGRVGSCVHSILAILN